MSHRKRPNGSHRYLVVASICLLLTACRTGPPSTVITVTAPPTLPPELRDVVWLPDQVAPYAVGRYVDPADRNLVHEAHTLYRREQTSRPNLTPADGIRLPNLSPNTTNTTTLLFQDALTAELNQQRTTSRTLIEQAQNLDKAVHQLNRQTQESRDALQEYARVRSQLVAVSNRLATLEDQLRSAPTTSPGVLPHNFSNSDRLLP